MSEAPKSNFINLLNMSAMSNKSAYLEKQATIEKLPNGWHVKSEEGKNLGGPYSTREEAVKRLRQVEYFKHNK